MIEIKNLHKYYKKNHLFKGIDMSIKRGEVVVIIGPSGSGKSTFLRCINGLESFQDGEIIIDGIKHSSSQNPSEKEAIRKIRMKVGMVFQQFNLFPHRTVLENIIEAPVHVLKEKKEKAIGEATALLKRVGLEEKINSYPDELSGGEQQRVAILRALAMKPEVMLFDEPTSSLDPEMVGEVLSVIKDLVNEGMTSIISTHEIDFAREVAHRIVVFDRGEIIEEGPPEEVLTNPQAERTRLFLRRILRKGMVNSNHASSRFTY